MADSPNLAMPEILTGMADKEGAITTGNNRIDNATQDTVDVVTTAGGTITLTSAQRLDNILIRLTGTPAGAYALDVPDGNRALHFENVSGQTATIDTVTGAAVAVVLADNETVALDFRSTDITVVGAIGDGTGGGSDAVLKSLFDAQTILQATSDDTPVALTVAEQTLVGRITSGNITALTAAQVNTLLGTVLNTLFDAQTILAATTDDTPAAVTVAEKEIVGRATSGNVAALTAAQVHTILGTTIGTIPLDLGTLREIGLDTADEISNLASHGGILAADSTPSYGRISTSTDKAIRVNWVLGNTDEVQFPPVAMPADLNETNDVTIHLLADMSGATDTPVIDVQVFDAVGDTEMGGNTATVTNTLAEKTVTISAANVSGHPLGFLNISLVPAAHGTDALRIYAAWVEYTRKVE